ncbi:MAG TPA: formimidoylglutamate deiminase [Pyrinomonadaceae bacterium]|nr:formimidoylglutamate deiminase [Pyrinomonadaceae bacterium]
MWQPELLFSGGFFNAESVLLCDPRGQVAEPSEPHQVVIKRELSGRALLPGLVNAHSHAFQRVIRGRTEYRTANEKDSFWTWREMMYSAAERLTPEDIYDASRMAFLEMALTGITAVGEFHYLHHALDGKPYDDPNLLAAEVVRAARDVGLRIALLRVAYARSGYEKDLNPQQRRFIETDPETYLKNLHQLRADLRRDYGDELAWVGIAPHSVRAVPLGYLKKVISDASTQQLPVHMHVAEQPAEVSACIEEYGRSPVALLATEGLLDERFTAVHAIHVTPKSVHMLAETNATVCACPTTERNLGDGIVPVDSYFAEGVRVSLGSDSHVQMDLLEDARELEYHLRLQKLERVVLGPSSDKPEAVTSALAARLFECATANGARSIKASSGALETGQAADFFTVDLDDPSIAGTSQDELLSAIVFSSSRTAVKDVVVGGKRIIEAGRHSQQDEIVEKFKQLQKKLWG